MLPLPILTAVVPNGADGWPLPLMYQRVPAVSRVTRSPVPSALSVLSGLIRLYFW